MAIPPNMLPHLTPQQISQVVANRLFRMQRILSTDHFVFRGTFESAIGEAQGIQLVKTAGRRPGEFQNRPFYNHLENLRRGRNELRNLLAQFDNDMHGSFAQQDEAGYYALLQSLAQMRQCVQQNVKLATRAEALAVELEQTHGDRLAGAPLAPRGRDEAALVSTQLVNARHWDGERTLLPPSLLHRDDVMQLFNDIKNLPLEEAEATVLAQEVVRSVRPRVVEAGRQAARDGDSIILVGASAGLQRMWDADGQAEGETTDLLQPRDNDGFDFPAGDGGEGAE
jgi:hypothetical protein